MDKFLTDPILPRTCAKTVFVRGPVSIEIDRPIKSSLYHLVRETIEMEANRKEVKTPYALFLPVSRRCFLCGSLSVFGVTAML